MDLATTKHDVSIQYSPIVGAPVLTSFLNDKLVIWRV